VVTGLRKCFHEVQCRTCADIRERRGASVIAGGVGLTEDSESVLTKQESNNPALRNKGRGVRASLPQRPKAGETISMSKTSPAILSVHFSTCDFKDIEIRHPGGTRKRRPSVQHGLD